MKLRSTMKSVVATAVTASCVGLGLMINSSVAKADAPNWVNEPDGWTAVALSSLSVGQPTGTVSLMMVSPEGYQAQVATFPQNTSVEDLSNDARRVLLRNSAGGLTTVTIFDTVTRSSKQFKLGELMNAKFTNPTGTNLLTTTDPGGSWQRRDFAGTVHANFTNASAQRNLVQSADGQLAMGVTKSGRISVNLNSTGQMLRSFATPGGRNCQPVRAHETKYMLVSCTSTTAAEVYQLNTSTGAWTSLSGALPKAPFGYITAVKTAKGLAVAEAPSCGPGQWGWASGKNWTPIPRTGENRSVIAFHADGQRALVAPWGCGGVGNRTLVSQSTTSTTGDILLAGGTKNPGKHVVGYAPVDRLN